MKKNIKKALALLIAVQMLMMSQQSFAQPELNQVNSDEVLALQETGEYSEIQEDSDFIEDNVISNLENADIMGNSGDGAKIQNQIESVHLDLSDYFDRYSFLTVNNSLSNTVDSAFNQAGMYIDDVLANEAYDAESGLFTFDGLTYNVNAVADVKSSASTSTNNMVFEITPGCYEKLGIIGGLHKVDETECEIKLYYQGEDEPETVTVSDLKTSNDAGGIIEARAINKKKLTTKYLSLYNHVIELDNTKVLYKIEIPKNSSLYFAVNAITLGIDLAGAEALAVENIQNAINSLGDRLVISDIPTIKNITSMLADAEEKGYDLSGLQNLDRYEVAEGKLEELEELKKIVDKIDALPGNKNNITKAMVDAISDMLEEAEDNGYDISLITNTDKYEAAKQFLKDNESVSVIYDMSGMYNTSRIYSSVPTYNNGQAGYAGNWYRDSFVSLPYWDEGIDWTETDTGEMTFEGIRFRFYVPDCVDNSDAKYATYRNTFGNDEKEFYPFKNIDLEDTYYKKLAIMANSERQNPGHILIRLNYADGSDEIYTQALNFFVNSASGKYISALRCPPEQERNGYLPMLEIPVDSSKVLESYDILMDRYILLTDDEGNYLRDEEGEVIPQLGTGSSRGNYPTACMIYAMTAVMAYKEYHDLYTQKLNEMDVSLENEIMLSGEVPVSISQKGSQVFDEMTSILKILEDEEFKAGLGNYNKILAVLPRFEGFSAQTDFYNVSVNLDYTLDMAEAEGFVSVLKNGEEFTDYNVKTVDDKVSVIFKNDYDYESKYKIIVNKELGTKASEEFTIGANTIITTTIPKITEISNFKIQNNAGTAIDSLSGYFGTNVKVKGDFKNISAGDDISYTIFACLYNGKGQMIDIAKVSGVFDEGATVSINETLTTDSKGNNSLKIYFWDSVSGMRTVYKTIVK